MSGRSTRSALSTSIRRRPRLDERRLAGAARTREQNVVRGEARDELARVLVDGPLLRLDGDQVRQRDQMRMRDRLQIAATTPLAPAGRGDALPVRIRRRRG